MLHACFGLSRKRLDYCLITVDGEVVDCQWPPLA